MENTTVEFETVQVKIPKAIMKMLSDLLDEPIHTYLERSIIQTVYADLQEGLFVTPEKIVQKYDLTKIFENYI